jgi:hypothetical protein
MKLRRHEGTRMARFPAVAGALHTAFEEWARIG